MDVFMIPGYGIPKDMEADLNYTLYLRTILNMIFRRAAGKRAVILFSGGNTDCVSPCRRIEAEEMSECFLDLMARTDVAKSTKLWKVALEPKAISTLENLLFLEKSIRARRLSGATLLLFCEALRAPRIALLVKKIFRRKRVTVVPIDFDQSKSRYVDHKTALRMHRELLAFDAWAIKNPLHLKKHHDFTLKKLAYLRTNAGNAPHADLLRTWWKEAMTTLPKLRKK